MDLMLRFFKNAPALVLSYITGILELIIPACWCAKDVSEDIVLITGGGSGLGRAIALEYAKLGSSLVLWDIDEKGMNESKNLIENELNKISGGNRRFCLTYKVDVSDKNEVKKYANQVHSDLNSGRKVDQFEKYVSVLVNNAGIFHIRFLQELTDEQIERIFKINIMAHFWTVREFLPNMIKHEKGHIVEIASLAGLNGQLKCTDYSATKYATVGFEEALSVELYNMGLWKKVRTTVVCPLFFRSNLFTGKQSSNLLFTNVDYVARETVKAMRCNYARVLLPKFSSGLLEIMKLFMSRDSYLVLGKILGLPELFESIQCKASLTDEKNCQVDKTDA